MWCWRRMLKIEWTDYKRNEDILNEIGEERQILKRIKGQQQRWIGHNLRHDTLLKTVMEGKYLGKRTRGRKRLTLIDGMKNNRSYVELKKAAQDREVWKNWMP
eukprot:Seg1709.10 transcript_id=Seg1709.10/GoldUCD/mRNA.D3Y31 product="hypothetical protein" protein_id=Seg1709.10/GoldUCD/D3Y31